jgi:hypothetical protein
MADRGAAAGRGRRCDEEERKRLGQIAQEPLAQTGCANARSAEIALRRQFKRRGWPLHTAARRPPPGARSWAGDPLSVGAKRTFKEAARPVDWADASGDES